MIYRHEYFASQSLPQARHRIGYSYRDGGVLGSKGRAACHVKEFRPFGQLKGIMSYTLHGITEGIRNGERNAYRFISLAAFMHKSVKIRPRRPK